MYQWLREIKFEVKISYQNENFLCLQEGQYDFADLNFCPYGKVTQW